MAERNAHALNSYSSRVPCSGVSAIAEMIRMARLTASSGGTSSPSVSRPSGGRSFLAIA